MHPIHVLADPAVHQAVAYVPMTAKDKATAVQASFVAGAAFFSAGLLIPLLCQDLNRQVIVREGRVRLNKHVLLLPLVLSLFSRFFFQTSIFLYSSAARVEVAFINVSVSRLVFLAWIEQQDSKQ